MHMKKAKRLAVIIDDEKRCNLVRTHHGQRFGRKRLVRHHAWVACHDTFDGFLVHSLSEMTA